ncbi:class I adenylate-forming enzyme family protein [Actinomycetes bacterium KLBMP 9759]
MSELALLHEAVAAADPARVAVRSGSAELTYGEVGALLAGSRGDVAPAGPLPVTGTVADVVALLRAAAAGRPVLVLDGHATEWERDRATASFAPDGPAVGLCTSGTTGLPKVVVTDWNDLLANAMHFALAAGFGPADVLWCATPMHHRYCFAGGLLGGLCVGATVALGADAGPSAFAAQVVEQRATGLLSVPFLYSWYLRELDRDPGLVARWSLRRCIAAGAPLPAAVAEQWLRRTGLPLLSHYGATEDGQITIGTGEPGEGVGQVIADREVRIDPAGQVLVRRAGTGEWRATGDTGHFDERGNLHLVGRLGDRLNIAGRKVDPVEVEDVLKAHPAVADCAVAAVPGPAGDEVVAFLVTVADVGDAELRRHLAAVLSAYKLPRKLVRVAEVPRSRTGKVRRGALVARVAARSGGTR